VLLFDFPLSFFFLKNLFDQCCTTTGRALFTWQCLPSTTAWFCLVLFGGLGNAIAFDFCEPSERLRVPKQRKCVNRTHSRQRRDMKIRKNKPNYGFLSFLPAAGGTLFDRFGYVTKIVANALLLAKD